MKKSLVVVYYDLGLGGVQRTIVDLVNYIGKRLPSLNILILLRRKTKFDISGEIRNKKTEIIYYSDWFPARTPFLFSVFVIYKIWKLKPATILSLTYLPSLFATWAKLMFFWRRTRLVISVHNFTSKIISASKYPGIHHLLIRIFFPFSDSIVCYTNANKKDLIKTYDISAQKIKIIPNWTMLADKKMAELSKTGEDYEFIYVGRLEKTKNVQYLFKSLIKFSKYKKGIKICVVGEGPEKHKLKNTKVSADFVGVQHNIEEFLKRAKIYILSPRYRYEGFPTTILEAMSVGVPVLVKRFAGLGEVVRDKENGVIFDSMDEFVEKALWLLENSQRREEIARRAKKYVQKHHSYKNMELHMKNLTIE